MNDLIFKAANVIHRAVLSLSGGRLGVDVLGARPRLNVGARHGRRRVPVSTG